MSQTNSDELEKYRGTAGAEVKTADVSSDDHALKQKLGNEDGSKERVYDPKIAGERFVQFYDDSAAAIREYLSNAETACIRRARRELLNAGFTKDEIPSEVKELLEMAKEECGYEPLIEVTYNAKPDETRFIIEDNGIGISTEEYQVVQRIGYSTSHDEGSRLGNFGMGWMSGFQLTSINGMFKMSTRSLITDEAYSTAEYVANCEYLDESPDEYGTRFEFPSFGEAAKNIDIASKVREFTEGMPVPVLYRHFDESGNEVGSKSDDFLATLIEDDYSDDSMVITFENEYFKAVMSPDRKESGRGLTTYNISMPIRRNTDGFGTNNSFDAPWKWDFRGKQEDGPIVECESDPSIEGLIPKEDTKYDKLMPELQEDCIPMSNVPDDAIVMPQPASSRDSFKGGHDDFWKHVSQKLNEEWASVAKKRFEELDTWDDFVDMSREEKEKLFRAYDHFGPKHRDTEPDKIQESIEESMGVTLSEDVCEKLDMSQTKVSVVKRGHNRAHTKTSLRGKRIWKVIDEAPDGIYMGKSISQKKAEIVWGLGETHLVRLTGKTETYDDYEESWGWTKAKELPNRNLKEKLPELDDDVAEKYENVSQSDSNNTQSSASTGGDGSNPKSYRGKVRVGTHSSKYYTTWRMENLKEKLEDGDTFKAGHYTCKYLVICDDDNKSRTIAGRADRKNNVAATGVPGYVYDYLKGTDNVYTSYSDVVDEHGGAEVTLSDGTTMDIRDVPETDLLINGGSKANQKFDGRAEKMAELAGIDTDNYDRFTIVGRRAFEDAWNTDTDATIVQLADAGRFYGVDGVTYKSVNYRDLRIKDALEGMDEDSDEYDALFGKTYGKPTGDTLDTLIDIAEKAGLTD